MKRNRASGLGRAGIALAVTLGIAVIVAISLVFRYFFSDSFIKSRIVTVPDLVGTVYGEDSLPDSAYFQVVRIERFDDAPIGTVLSQEPAAGSRRKAVDGVRFVTLTLSISKGKEVATVPSVKGLGESRGAAALIGAGFAVEIRTQYSSLPYGEILASEPAAGSTAEVGSVVTLTVSRGTATRDVRVPELAGLTLVRAKSLLQACGLRVGTVRYRETGGEEGRVLSQLPNSLVTLPEGAAVDLTVSRRPPETTLPEETEVSPEEGTQGSHGPDGADDTDRSETRSDPNSTADAPEVREPDGARATPEELIDRILGGIFGQVP